MAVAHDSKFQDGSGTASSPFSFTSNAPASGVAGTVGANSNRVLIGAMAVDGILTLPTMSWNGVAMTQIGSIITNGGFYTVLFGLINPDTGNQILSGTFVTAGGVIVLGAVSLYNADQTTGWQNDTSATGTSTTLAVTVTSANGNMAVVATTDANASSASITAGTEDWQERDLNGNYLAGHRASSSSSTAISWTLGTSVAWAAAGVDVIAASTAFPDELQASRRTPVMSVP